MDLAPQFGLSPQVIEKDYVLGGCLLDYPPTMQLRPAGFSKAVRVCKSVTSKPIDSQKIWIPRYWMRHI